MGREDKKEVVDELANGYEQILEHAVRDFGRTEQKTEHLLHRLILEAKDKVSALKKLSQEQAEQVAEYVARDVDHLRHYIATTGNEVKDWLGFEAVVLESEILDLLVRAADSATVDAILRKNAAQSPPVKYAAGEIAGPGSLVCKNCEAVMELHRATKIAPCPECGHRKFARFTS